MLDVANGHRRLRVPLAMRSGGPDPGAGSPRGFPRAPAPVRGRDSPGTLRGDTGLSLMDLRGLPHYLSSAGGGLESLTSRCEGGGGWSWGWAKASDPLYTPEERINHPCNFGIVHGFSFSGTPSLFNVMLGCTHPNPQTRRFPACCFSPRGS